MALVHQQLTKTPADAWLIIHYQDASGIFPGHTKSIGRN